MEGGKVTGAKNPSPLHTTSLWWCEVMMDEANVLWHLWKSISFNHLKPPLTSPVRQAVWRERGEGQRQGGAPAQPHLSWSWVRSHLKPMDDDGRPGARACQSCL